MAELKTIKSQYKQLTDIEHALLRAEMYVGSRVAAEQTKYLLHADGKIYADSITCAPATITLVNEVICNAFDEAVRTRTSDCKTPWQLDKIDVVVDLDKCTLTCRDNGGIQVAIDEATNLPIPTLLFGHLRTGSNYTDERGTVVGQNGIGVTLVNIFSKHFHLKTADGLQCFCQSWHDNMTKVDEPCIYATGDHFTEITAEFDLDTAKTKLPENCYSMTWARCIEARCMELAAMAAGWDKPLTVQFSCKFTDEQGNVQNWTNSFCFKRFDDYLKLWPDCSNFIIDKQYRFNIALGLSTGSMESSALVNGQQCPWGTHIDAFIDACVYHIRAHMNNRYKYDMKPAKIKSYFKCISTWQINAATFSGQTKEILVSDVKDFGMPVIPSEQFIRKLLRSNVVQTIVEEMHSHLRRQHEAEVATKQKDIDKRSRRNILPQKLADAANAGKPGKFARLYVVEGDSAAAGLKKFRNAEVDGVFALFGKSCGNMLGADELRVLGNKALSALCQGLGFSFLGGTRLRYEQIIITTDADYDGYSIAGLLLTFFNKFMPEIIEQGKLYRLATPIMTAHNMKSGELRQYYTLPEFEADKANLRGKDWHVSYKKGLASLEDEDYDIIMNQPRLIQIVKDDFADSSLTDWFGNDSSRRKELMSMQDVIDDSVFENLYDNGDDDEQA